MKILKDIEELSKSHIKAKQHLIFCLQVFETLSKDDQKRLVIEKQLRSVINEMDALEKRLKK